MHFGVEEEASSQSVGYLLGAAILSHTAKVPIVPVYLEGLQAIRPPGTKEVTPGPVAAHVLEPVFPGDMSVPEITQAVFDQMKQAHEAALSRRS